MNTRPAANASEVFFLDVGAGQRFCLYHPPSAGKAVCGAVLVVQPFAEEMNKSRRMVALQTRALAAAGYGVLQIDLAGCGDSSGDFNDARWDLWLADLAAAHHWLHQRLAVPATLLALRLGALLAVDYAGHASLPLARLTLWQPVLQGGAFLKQFLRLRVASEMMGADGDGAAEASGGTAAMRTALLAGQSLEVAGYELHGALAAAIDGLDAAKLPAPVCPVDWFDIVASTDRPAAPAVTGAIDKWRKRGAAVTLHRVAGPAFWSTQEIELCPALLDATSAALTIDAHDDARSCA